MTAYATDDLLDYDEAMERFDPVLGLEVHVELSTASKTVSYTHLTLPTICSV